LRRLVLRCGGVAALGVVITCTDPETPGPLEARGLRALLSGAASITAVDTVCVSVAAPGGEVDPGADVLRAVRADFPAAHVRRHRCTMAKGAETAECEYVAPGGAEQSGGVPPT